MTGVDQARPALARFASAAVLTPMEVEERDAHRIVCTPRRGEQLRQATLGHAAVDRQERELISSQNSRGADLAGHRAERVRAIVAALAQLDRLQKPCGDLGRELAMSVEHLANATRVHADARRGHEDRDTTLGELPSKNCGVYALLIKLGHDVRMLTRTQARAGAVKVRAVEPRALISPGWGN